METEKLEQLGLTKNEAKIYLTLLEFAEAQAGQISKKSGINRTTTYDSIERLVKKGLVSYAIQANKKVFRAANPDKITKNIKEQEELAKTLVPELKNIYKKTKEESGAQIYKGRKGIRSILQDILEYKDYVAFGSRGRFLEVMKHDFEIFQKRKKELKIKSRVILRKSDKSSESVKLSFSEFRFVPDEYASPTTTFVYGGNVAIIVWSETPIATLIENKEVAESYNNYFELLWRNAK